MKKQDRIYPRTAVALQRKYGKKVTEGAETAVAARQEAEQAAEVAQTAAQNASKSAQAVAEMESKLDLTLKVNENGEVISEINGVANVIKFLANCISIQSDKFKLTEDGSVEINGGSIVLAMKDGETVTGYVKIGEKFARLSVDSTDYAFGSGCSLGLLANAVCFSAGGAENVSLPIQFSYVNGEYRFGLVGDWYIERGTVHLANKIKELEERIKALEG